MRATRFQRFIGLTVLGTVGSAAGLLWWLVAVGARAPGHAPDHGVLFGLWHIVYDDQAPRPEVLLTAIALALLMAGAVALVDWRILTRARRSLDRASLPLSPRIVMAETRGVYAGPITLTVLIPAHNEEVTLPSTLSSLRGQSYEPEQIIVVADNCTDRTVAIARAANVRVFESVDNVHKKGGALNQVLAQILPEHGDNDLIMVMDADTVLDAGFLETVVNKMSVDRALMAVGGLFYGEEGAGWLGQYQRNEYIRYAREMKRRRGKVFVLTGTASVFRPRALRSVAQNRSRTIPGTPGDVYDTAALTEDNELTMALKSLGALMVSPPECTVVTEVMPNWRALWNQRLRWQRGALENLGAYGITTKTFRYWAQQLGIGYGAVSLGAYLFMMSVMLVCMDTWVWFPFWVGVGVVFAVERVVTVWRGGWRARLVAVTLLPELYYATFLNVVFFKGILDMSFARQAEWTYIARGADEELGVKEPG